MNIPPPVPLPEDAPQGCCPESPTVQSIPRLPAPSTLLTSTPLLPAPRPRAFTGFKAHDMLGFKDVFLVLDMRQGLDLWDLGSWKETISKGPTPETATSPTAQPPLRRRRPAPRGRTHFQEDKGGAATAEFCAVVQATHWPIRKSC